MQAISCVAWLSLTKLIVNMILLFLNTLRKNLVIEYLYSLFIIASFSTFIHRIPIELFSESYDIDIDHEMYFGSRLMIGELLYTKELHDKLPIVQFLFYIPALYKSVLVFKIISIFLVIASSLMLYFYLRFSFDYFESTITRNQRYIASLTSCSIYLSLNSLLFLCHVSTVASSLLMISTIFCFQQNFSKNRTNNSRRNIYYVAALLFGSCAISMRPYLFAPIISTTFSSLSRDIFISRSYIKKNITTSNVLKYLLNSFYQILKYMTFLTVFLLILNITPYVFTNNIIHFYDGIRHNLQKLNPENIEEIFQHQGRIILQLDITLKLQMLCIIIYITNAFLFYIFDKSIMSKSKKLFINNLFMNVILNILLIEVMILTRHFWPHYLEMFIPFISLSVGYMVAFTLIGSTTNSQLFGDFNKYFGYIIYTFALFTGMMSPYQLSHPHLLQLDVTKRVLEARKLLGLELDFLYVTNMYVHWQLSESRNGFPHAANIDHIGRGWWNKVERTNVLNFPYSREDLCNKLQHSEIHVIFTELNSFSFECMNQIPQKYKQENFNNVYIFSKVY